VILITAIAVMLRPGEVRLPESANLPPSPATARDHPPTALSPSTPTERELKQVAAHPRSSRNASTQDEPEEPLFEKLLKGGSISLTEDQVNAFLESHRRSADSLVALGDLASLREGMERFPSDALLKFQMAIKGETAEERRSALRALTDLSPNNPLGDYLSAHRSIVEGDTEQALKNLATASAKPSYYDFFLDQAQAREELYLSTGMTPTDAKAAGMFGIEMPHLQELRDLGRQLARLQEEHAAKGDVEKAEAIRDMGLNMAWQLQASGSTLLHELVGVVIEKNLLQGADPGTALLTDGTTAGQRLEALDHRKDYIREMAKYSDLLTRLPEHDLLSYLDRSKAMGEINALEWLSRKYEP